MFITSSHRPRVRTAINFSTAMKGAGPKRSAWPIVIRFAQGSLATALWTFIVDGGASVLHFNIRNRGTDHIASSNFDLTAPECSTTAV